MKREEERTRVTPAKMFLKTHCLNLVFKEEAEAEIIRIIILFHREKPEFGLVPLQFIKARFNFNLFKSCGPSLILSTLLRMAKKDTIDFDVEEELVGLAKNGLSSLKQLLIITRKKKKKAKLAKNKGCPRYRR